MQEATVGASRTQARSGKLALRGEANHISQFIASRAREVRGGIRYQ
jgi:hypothetical protein